MMKIRTAGLNDSDSIAALAGQLGYPTSAEEVRSRMIGLADEEDCAVFVCAGDGGTVYGWTLVHVVVSLYMDKVAELSGMVVDEQQRGKGIGQLLLNAAERWAQEQGCSRLRVRSNVVRTRAHEFYTRLGYSTVKSQRVFEKRFDI